MRLHSPALLPVLFTVLFAAPLALAQDARWKLGKEKLRYGHMATKAPDPAAPTAPALPQHLLVDQSMFPDGRTPKRTVRDPGDLIWQYALTIPSGGKKRGRGPRRVDVDDTFAIKGGALKVHGNHSVRTRGAKITVRSSLLITCTAKKHWFKRGSLLLNSSYNTKRGRLERATYRFEITQSYATTATPPETKTRTDTWEGRVQTDIKVKVAAKTFHTGVQGAIDRGKAWLLKKTHERLNAYKALPAYPGQGLGKMALPCFALLRSGVDKKQLRGEFAWMMRQPFRETYSVSLWVMALEALAIRRESRAPVARSRTVARYQRGKVDPRDLERMKRAVRWLLAARKDKQGWWSYYGPPPAKTDGGARGGPLGHDGKTQAKVGDRSNSQFAVLALHSATASGIEIPAAVWVEIHEEVVRSQQAKGPKVSLSGSKHAPDSPLSYDPRDELVEPDTTYVRKKRTGTGERINARSRGWAYRNRSRAKAGTGYGSMSSAGTSTAAIAREGLKKTNRLNAKRDEQSLAALRDGLAWLLHHYDVARNPGRADDRWYYYYAYSLEKALDLSGIERLGPREWWQDLSAELLARQQPDGSWRTLEDTSFALLVLNRATLPVQLEISKAKRVATGKLQASSWDKVKVVGPKKDMIELKVRQLLGAMATTPHDAAGRLELARRAMAALDVDHRPRAIPELSELFRHPHKATRSWANETCRKLAGTTKLKLLRRFCDTWEEVRQIGDGLDHRRIPRLRELLAGADSTRLKQHLIKTLVRLQAVEATGDLITQLNAKDLALRKHTWTWLISLLAHAHMPFDPNAGPETRAAQVAAWSTWWNKERNQLVEAERGKRAVRDLAYPGRVKAGSDLLLKLGDPGLRPLVDALRVEKTRKVAHGLLQKITKQKLPPEAAKWLAWLDARDRKRNKK